VAETSGFLTTAFGNIKTCLPPSPIPPGRPLFPHIQVDGSSSSASMKIIDAEVNGDESLLPGRRVLGPVCKACCKLPCRQSGQRGAVARSLFQGPVQRNAACCTMRVWVVMMTAGWPFFSFQFALTASSR
jgi:hypothetical protein